jgi:hypothetical protein
MIGRIIMVRHPRAYNKIITHQYYQHTIYERFV